MAEHSSPLQLPPVAFRHQAFAAFCFDRFLNRAWGLGIWGDKGFLLGLYYYKLVFESTAPGAFARKGGLWILGAAGL